MKNTNQFTCPECGAVFQANEAAYESIAKQVKDKEFYKELKEREAQFESDKAQAIQIAKMEAEKKLNEQINEKDIQITQLKTEIEANELSKINQIKTAISEKDKEIVDLKHKLEEFNKDKELEINNIVSKKDAEIVKLKSENELCKKESQLQEKSLKEKFQIEIKNRDDEIEKLRDYKLKQSIKLIGESLEQHCLISFNQARSLGFQGAYFEKDNKAVERSKGDFIFRDYDDEGNEYISIMFEAKDESIATSPKNKKKNKDFLKKLDKDRRQNNCEYAVLISMLEQDNDLYNAGIVDVSHKYEKMYVIRPQYFIPMITLLRNTARKTIKYQKELKYLREQNNDMTILEEGLNNVKGKLSKNVISSSTKLESAICDIDKTISQLEKIRENLLSSNRGLSKVNDDLEDLTIKKLTGKKPAIKAKSEPKKITKQK